MSDPQGHAGARQRLQRVLGTGVLHMDPVLHLWRVKDRSSLSAAEVCVLLGQGLSWELCRWIPLPAFCLSASLMPALLRGAARALGLGAGPPPPLSSPCPAPRLSRSPVYFKESVQKIKLCVLKGECSARCILTAKYV